MGNKWMVDYSALAFSISCFLNGYNYDKKLFISGLNASKFPVSHGF